MTERLHDSGTRRQFSTGAVRDCAEGKGRPDLFQVFALMRLARHLERGAKKYDDRNWEKGIPVSKFMDSGIRHALEALSGLDDEDHLAAALWNFACAIDTLERVNLHIFPSELDDLPKPLKGFKKVNPGDSEATNCKYYDTAFGKLEENNDHFFKRTLGIGDNEKDEIECVTEIPYCTLILNKETLKNYNLHQYFHDCGFRFKDLEFKICQGYQDCVVIIDTGKPKEQQTLRVPAKYLDPCSEQCVGNCERCQGECLK